MYHKLKNQIKFLIFDINKGLLKALRGLPQFNTTLYDENIKETTNV